MRKNIIAMLVIMGAIGITAQAQELPTSGAVETRIGKLTFEGGYPSHKTIDKLYDEMDFQRAVQAYLWAIPLIGFAQWQAEHENVFGAKDGDLVLYASYRDKLGLLTANATTPISAGLLICPVPARWLSMFRPVRSPV